MRVASRLGVGSISQVLRHPVHATVRRFRLPTEHGPLYGTLDHPLHLNGSWIEAGEAHRRDLLPGLEVDREPVDYLWNLEVDGKAEAGGSAHAYDVNGLTASGLGDSERLNRLYPRQQVFIQAASATRKAAPTPSPSAMLLPDRGAGAVPSGADTLGPSLGASSAIGLLPSNCPVWDAMAEGSQTCGDKVLWLTHTATTWSVPSLRSRGASARAKRVRPLPRRALLRVLRAS